MAKVLGALVVLEGAVILVLVFLLAGGRDSSRSDGGLASPQPASEATKEPTRPGVESMEGREVIAREVSEPPAVLMKEDEWRADDPAGLLIYGSITDARGKLIDGAIVYLEDESTEHFTGRIERGSGYSIAGLHPGKWALSVSARGFDTLERELILEKSPAVRRLDWILSSAIVLKTKFLAEDGRLLRDHLSERGLRFVFIVAVATSQAPGNVLPMTDRQSYSRFGLGVYRSYYDGGYGRPEDAGDFDGELQLEAPPPLHISAVYRHVVLATTMLPTPAREIVLTVPARKVLESLSKLEACFVDAEDGTAIEGLRIGLGGRAIGGARQVTGADGRVVFENQQPGLLLLETYGAGRERLSYFVRLRPGESRDLGRIAISNATHIKGVVLDAQGQPVRGSVSCFDLDRREFPQPLRGAYGTGTREEGQFEIEGVGRGRNLVVVRTDDLATRAVIADTSSGPVEGLKIILGKGTAVALEPSFGPDEIYLVQVLDSGGLLLYSSLRQDRWTVHLRLVPGRYTVNIHDDRGLMSSHPLMVGSEPARMTIRP